MAKVLKISLILCMFLNASAVFASITRTRTMGDAGILVKDDANYWLFPSALVYSSNRAILELGGTPELVCNSLVNYGFDQWAGSTVRLSTSDLSTLGVFFSEAANISPFHAFPTGSLTADHKFDVFYGRKTMYGSIGVHVARASGLRKSTRDPGSDSKTSATQTRVDFGFSQKNVDATFGFQLSTSKTSGADLFGHSYALRLRMFKPINEVLTFVPVLDFNIGFENKDNSEHYNALIWNLWTGAGFNYQVNEGDLLVLGLSVLRSSQSVKTERTGAKTGSTVFDLPFVFGGIESELFPWLKLRLGFQKALRRTTSTNVYSNTSVKDSRSEAPFAATAGLGLEYKRLTLDLSWDADFLQRGPYFISGSKGDMFNLISVSYCF